MSDRQYLGWPCPHCGERKLGLGSTVVDTMPAVLTIECEACGKHGEIYEDDPALLLSNRNRELEAIVRAVAGTHPIGDWGDGIGCFFCEGPGDEPDGHDDDCPWLRARKALDGK